MATGLVASVVVSLWFVRAPAKLVRLAAQHRDTALALVKDLPPDTPVYALGPTAELAHRTSLKVRELFSETSAALAAQRARGGPIYLVYDPKAVARWRTGDEALAVYRAGLGVTLGASGGAAWTPSGRVMATPEGIQEWGSALKWRAACGCLAVRGSADFAVDRALPALGIQFDVFE